MQVCNFIISVVYGTTGTATSLLYRLALALTVIISHNCSPALGGNSLPTVP